MTDLTRVVVLRVALSIAVLAFAQQAWVQWFRRHNLGGAVMLIGLTLIFVSMLLGTGIAGQVVGVVGMVLVFISLGVRAARWIVRNAR